MVYRVMLPQTEDSIERAVERMFNRLDNEFMSGNISEDEYNLRSEAIDEWAEHEYQFIKTIKE